MKKGWLLLIVVLILVCVAQAALLVFLSARSGWQRSATESTIERGRRIAERMGCFGCHGPGGVSPIPNPDSTYGEVPGWAGGTWMMWNNTEGDVRAWIVDGHPTDRAPDPNALIPMPAYGDRISGGDLDDLVSYVLAVSQFGWPEDPQVADGREVAVRFGCFGCHGPEGRGLIWNPGSYKGFIPAWDSEDYLELVRDDDEFRQWVRNGISDRFQANPPARFILNEQPIRMPAYSDRITDQQLDALIAYVAWVRAESRDPRSKR